MNKPLVDNMILISLDALKADDIEILKKLPNFSLLMNYGVFAKRVKTIYPSLTYPAHTTIVTGNYPKNHGIINNKLLKPSNNLCPWFWYRKYIKTPTLYDAAKENNLTVASIFWPVSANSSIKYNMPEVFSYKKYIPQEMSSLLSGSITYQLKLFRKYSNIKKGIKEPELDNFALACAVDTIKSYKPNLLMVHLLDLDTQRHDYGTNSPEAYEALKRHDTRIGKLITTLKEVNLFDKTNFIVLGDHGFQDFNKIIYVNNLFKKEGLLITDKNNKILRWKAYLKSCDGSAYIYINDPSDKLLLDKVKNLLDSLASNSENGIKSIYNNNQLTSLGCDPHAAFMLEAEKGFAFSEKINTNSIISSSKNAKSLTGTHGYSPENPNLDTFFMASGPAFKKGYFIDNMNLIDIAPTLAKALNIDFYQCDGKSIDDFFIEKVRN
ncbi:alkaline phosphatase family protein [Clostridium culturomicium]|uniref:alkaline phosphatase family protein n=1 Tax=Clostridium culturomicium TaxID=1499683 RepID=UPI003857A4E0